MSIESPRERTLGGDDRAERATGAERLVIVVGGGVFTTCRVPARGELVIGRDAGCELRIDHPRISRRHAAIRAGAPPAIVDLGSKNGVVVAGRRLARGEAAPLGDGASAQVGPVAVVVVEAGRGSLTSEDGRPRAALTVRDPTPAGVPKMIERVARSGVSVLVLGETGTGKEVLARTVHTLSDRRGPFVAINCAALTEALLESELFGHERGAFTGAVQAKPGLLEAAAGGTVFLDEVGELPVALQAKLLRAVEDRHVLRVGGIEPREVDVRFVAATHRDLLADVDAGAFRRDLYYRLNGITLTIPPLRERADAIPSLAQQFVAAAAERTAEPPPRLGAAALELLARHPWPGNVRELRAVIERAVLLATGGEIRPRHLLLDAPTAAPPPAAAVTVAGDADERARILEALDACAGNQTRAAAMLGMARTTLSHKLAVYKIPRPRAR